MILKTRTNLLSRMTDFGIGLSVSLEILRVQALGTQILEHHLPQLTVSMSTFSPGVNTLNPFRQQIRSMLGTERIPEIAEGAETTLTIEKVKKK